MGKKGINLLKFLLQIFFVIVLSISLIFMFISYRSVNYDDRDVQADLTFYHFTKYCLNNFSYLNLSEDHLNSCVRLFPNSSLEVRVNNFDMVFNKKYYEKYKDYCGFKGSVLCKSLVLPVYTKDGLERLKLFVVITSH